MQKLSHEVDYIIPNFNNADEEEIAILVSIGTKFGYNFKVMRMKVIHVITVFKLIVHNLMIILYVTKANYIQSA